MKISLLLSLALAALLSTGCKAPSPRTCNDHYAGGQAPVINSDNLSKHTTTLCFQEYALAFSGVSRTPLWLPEHLTGEHVVQAKGMKRKTTFHAEDKLTAQDRSELSDYASSGYDRGHMALSGDMPTETAQHESFSLANMIPQNPNNNQMLWAAIEEATRTLAEKDGQL